MVLYNRFLICFLYLSLLFHSCTLQNIFTEEKTRENQFSQKNLPTFETLILYHFLIAEKLCIENNYNSDNNTPQNMERKEKIEKILELSEKIIETISIPNTKINPYLCYRFLKVYNLFSMTKSPLLQSIRQFKNHIYLFNVFIENYIKNEYRNLTKEELSLLQTITELNDLTANFDYENSNIIKISSFDKTIDNIIYKPYEFLKRNKKYVFVTLIVSASIYYLYRSMKEEDKYKKYIKHEESKKNVAAVLPQHSFEIKQYKVLNQKGLTCGLHALKNVKATLSNNQKPRFNEPYPENWERISGYKENHDPVDFYKIINEDRVLKRSNIIILNTTTYFDDNIAGNFKEKIKAFPPDGIDNIEGKIKNFQNGEPIAFIINTGKNNYLDDNSWLKRAMNFLKIPLGKINKQNTGHWLSCVFQKDKVAIIHDSLNRPRVNCSYFHYIAKMLEDAVKQEENQSIVKMLEDEVIEDKQKEDQTNEPSDQ